MKTFTFFWLNGKREVLQGFDEADALNRNGYGHGALLALDFHAKDDNNDYIWNPITRSWDITESAKKKLFHSYIKK